MPRVATWSMLLALDRIACRQISRSTDSYGGSLNLKAVRVTANVAGHQRQDCLRMAPRPGQVNQPRRRCDQSTMKLNVRVATCARHAEPNSQRFLVFHVGHNLETTLTCTSQGVHFMGNSDEYDRPSSNVLRNEQTFEEFIL